MIVNNNLRLTKILELVDRLSDAVRRFGEQETLLTADYNTKLVAQQRAFELESWNQSQALSQRLVTEDAQYQTVVEHGQARFERREEWIRRAERNSRKQALEQVEQQEGRRKYQLQKSVLENDRRREAELANAAAELAAFKQQLAETELTSAELEAAAGKAFRGFGQFRRFLLSSSQSIPEADLSPDEHHLHAALLELQQGTRERVDQFRRLLLPRLFGRLSIWLMMILVVAGHSVAVPLLHRFGVQTVSYSQIGFSLAGILILLLLLFHYGRAKARPMARAITLDLARAQQMREACYQKAEACFQRTQATIQEDHRRTKEKLDQ